MAWANPPTSSARSTTIPDFWCDGQPAACSGILGRMTCHGLLLLLLLSSSLSPFVGLIHIAHIHAEQWPIHLIVDNRFTPWHFSCPFFSLTQHPRLPPPPSLPLLPTTRCSLYHSRGLLPIRAMYLGIFLSSKMFRNPSTEVNQG
jgi:hypothetical protein